MRPMLPLDLDLATRVLMVLPVGNRRAAMEEMLATARDAEAFRRRTGRLLCGKGDGSLLSVALNRRRADPVCVGRAYRDCLGIVLACLAAQDGDAAAG